MFRTITHLRSWQLCGILVATTFPIGMSTQAQSVEGQATQTSADEAPLFVCRFIEVSSENVAEWKQKVAEKNAKFGTADDPSRWGTWRIITGERTNQYARGFSTTAELYSNPKHAIQGMAATRDLPEAAYWQKHVAPLQESTGNQQIWKIIPGLQAKHLDASQTPKFMKHRRWRMKPGMYQRLEANYSKLIEVYKQMDLSFDFLVARLFDGGDFMIYAETYAFDKLSELPQMELVSKEFNRIHGDGAWDKFLEEHNHVMQENAIVESETWAYQEELSNL